MVRWWTFGLLGVLALGVVLDVWFTAQALSHGIPEANPVAGTIMEWGGLRFLLAMKIVLLIVIAGYLGSVQQPHYAVVVVLGLAAIAYMAMTVLHLVALSEFL